MHYLYWIHLESHTDMFTQGYIGHAKNFNARMRDHKRQVSRKKSKFYNAAKKYGWDNLIKEIILIGPDEQYCSEVEFKLRPLPNIGWNLQPGGSHSPSVLQEVKDKISNAMRGKSQSTEQVAKRVSKNRGQKRTQEQRDNISKALKEAKGTKATYEVTHPDGFTEIVFGMKPWCSENGLSSSSMFKLSSGKIDYYKGYSCKKLTTSCEHFGN